MHYANINHLLKALTKEDKETLLGLLAKTRGSLRAHAVKGCGKKAVSYAEGRQ